MKLPGSKTLWIVAGVSFAACVLMWLRHPAAPLSHDEFSYLLAGETFASGRLANPVHPLWEHFESMHVLSEPAYASKYLPGQGLALALGALVGLPILGVWLSMAVASAAVAWMLEGWMKRPWPLVGGLAVALHPQLVQAWGGTFWGGAVAMLGGALVYGALPRLLKQPGARHALYLGAGLSLLAVTRPFEGAVACLPVGAVLFWALGGSPRWLTSSTYMVLLGCFAATVAFLGLVNYAATGSPWTLPYVAFHEQYEVAPVFLFGKLRAEPEYNHAVLRTFYTVSAVEEYEALRTISGYLDGIYIRLLKLMRFFVGFGFLPAVVLVFVAWRDVRVRFTFLGVVLFAAALSIETFSFPHYAAPFVACGALLVTCVVLRIWEIQRWQLAARFVLIALGSSMLMAHVMRAEEAAETRASYGPSRRPALVEGLREEGGQHLVIVRYAEDHNPHLEWVYNAADIDASDVVWAREMDAERNARLLSYFAGRRIWLLRPDWNPDVLEPYPVAQDGG